jgi:hypothetical protein
MRSFHVTSGFWNIHDTVLPLSGIRGRPDEHECIDHLADWGVLTRLSQLVRVCGENRRLGGRKSLLINKTFSYARVVQTYPLFRL